MLPILLSSLFSCFVLSAYARSRTSPPSGSVVVNASSTTAGSFKTLASAIASLPNDSSSRSIFLFPGTYKEQVLINRTGPLTIFSYTTDTEDFTKNEVVITHSASLATAGSDDASGTVRIKSNNVALYNIDVRNDFGVANTNGQALALSEYGSKFGAYACRFFSYQDTLYANEGTQVYLKSYIEGAVDFIFGRRGQAYFEGNTIASKGAGCITASGRETNDSGIYVFDKNRIIVAPDAFSNVTGNVFLGRPWRDFARVIFKNTVIDAPLNKAVWSQWIPGDPRTDHILFAEFNSTGPGVAGASRPSFVTVLASNEASKYTIATAVGNDYVNWVDKDYLS